MDGSSQNRDGGFVSPPAARLRPAVSVVRAGLLGPKPLATLAVRPQRSVRAGLRDPMIPRSPRAFDMPLRDELCIQGAWLFRWRSYLPVLLLALVFFELRDFTYPLNSALADRLWDIFCVAVSFAGLGIRIRTVGCTPRGTSGRNTRKQVAESLNTSGTYSVVRHPLYVGNYLIWLGVALFPRSWELLALVTLVFWLYYERIMMAEEAFLEAKFGESYRDWARRTPAFLPRLSQWRRPDLPFSLRNVLRREFSGFFAIMLVFTALEATGQRVFLGRWELDIAWMVALTFSTGLYLVLRTLKRKTELLRVPGR